VNCSAGRPLSKATFSFELRIAGSTEDLEAACKVRSLAYGRHTPSLQEQLSRPEQLDTSPGVVVLVCRDKHSGRAVASARVQTNAYGPLLIERSIVVPADIACDSRAEITRLSVIPGGDPQAKLALFKGVYLCCLAMQVRWMIVGARSDSLRVQYERLGFEPLRPGVIHAEMVPLVHTGNLPHHVLRFDVTSAERHWHEHSNGLYRFMFRTFHPDVHLLSSVVMAVPPRWGSQSTSRELEAADHAETVDRSAGVAAGSESDSQRLTVLDKSSSLKGLARTASIPASKQA
jgi:hypothetical protein